MHFFVDLQRWGGGVTLLELYQLFFPLERWQPTPSQAAHIRAELGSIYHHLGQKEEARNELEQALNLFQSIDELPVPGWRSARGAAQPTQARD